MPYQSRVGNYQGRQGQTWDQNSNSRSRFDNWYQNNRQNSNVGYNGNVSNNTQTRNYSGNPSPAEKFSGNLN